MSYSDDLDWLARNVHEWPSGEHQSWCYVGRDYLSGDMRAAGHTIRMVQPGLVRRDDWLARRAELQVKAEPHPFTGLDEAIRKVLSVMRTEPEAFTPKELSEMKGICDAELAKLDTLEKRPDMHKNHEEIDTSPERVQKRPESVHNTRLDPDWWPTKLPPIGVVCIAVPLFAPKARCKIIAYSREQVALRWLDNGLLDLIELYDADGNEVISFDRMPTELEALIEVIKNAHVDAANLAAAILDAGFRRDGGNS